LLQTSKEARTCSEVRGLILIQFNSYAAKSGRKWTHVANPIRVFRMRPSHARDLLKQSVEVDLPETLLTKA
jgi:hypothetical protein